MKKDYELLEDFLNRFCLIDGTLEEKAYMLCTCYEDSLISNLVIYDMNDISDFIEIAKCIGFDNAVEAIKDGVDYCTIENGCIMYYDVIETAVKALKSILKSIAANNQYYANVVDMDSYNRYKEYFESVINNI